MTKEDARKLFESEFWKDMDFKQRAIFQINKERLCMPFDVFHEAVEKTLGRPVWTHEFGLNYDGIKAELNGNGAAPTMEEIINIIPEDKRILIVVRPARPDKG